MDLAGLGGIWRAWQDSVDLAGIVGLDSGELCGDHSFGGFCGFGGVWWMLRISANTAVFAGFVVCERTLRDSVDLAGFPLDFANFVDFADCCQLQRMC